MRRFARVSLACLIVGNSFIEHGAVYAQQVPLVAIRTIQTADQHIENDKLVTKSDDELVELENTTDTAIDITGWKLQYLTASNTYPMHTFGADMSGGHVFLPAHAREVLFSSSYMSNHTFSAAGVPTDYKAAFHFTQNLSATGGSIQLTNGVESIDAVKWGSAADAVAAPSATSVLRRVSYTGTMRSDFLAIAQENEVYSFGNTYSQADVCVNLPGYQTEMPEGYGLDTSEACVSLDVCPNLDGVQADIPTGLELYDGTCQPAFAPAGLQLTELLANPSGVDTGNEYIELENPTGDTVALKDYYLLVGTKHVIFPTGTVIPPHTYRAFSDLELGIVLPNMTGLVITLLSRNNIELATTPQYTNADIDMAWALIDGTWQYTNQPTPSGVNMPSVDEETLPIPPTEPVACHEGYYRSPDTNRCRKITATEVPLACKPNQYRSEETGRCRNYAAITTPAVCRDGQYRSEETGRCRSIAQAVSAELKPCSDDQFRNPATGRCKKIASTEDILEPCQAGWERNPTTNRCRKITVTDMPLANYPVVPTPMSTQTVATWWAIGGIATLAFVYAGWEWRHEIMKLVSRLRGASIFGRH